MSDDEKLQCMLCDMRSTNLNTHIVRTHCMKLDEYRRRFPNVQTCKLTRKQIERMRQTKLKNGENTTHRRYLDEKRQREFEFNDMLMCRMCGHTSTSSLISHITRKHKMKMDEYRRQWSDDIVQRSASSTKKKVAVSTKEAMSRSDVKVKVAAGRSFPSELKHWTRKGCTDNEARRKVSEHQTMLALKQNNPITKAQQSKRTRGEANPMSLTSIMERYGVTRREAAKMTPCWGRTGDAHPMYGKKHTEEALEKIANALHLKEPTFQSCGENQLAESCKAMGHIVRNIGVATINVDILFCDKKLIVEFFGDYWHANPKKYDDDWYNTQVKRTGKEIRERDAKKLQSLREAGYEVIVVWEHDWKYMREDVMKEINDAYNRA